MHIRKTLRVLRPDRIKVNRSAVSNVGEIPRRLSIHTGTLYVYRVFINK